MTREEFDKNCWPYYLYLENSFLETTRFVHLSIDNYACYSYEYNSLLITISTEFENIIKILYKTYGHPMPTRRICICDFFTAVRGNIFSPVNASTRPMAYIIDRTDMVFDPFASFCTGSQPSTSNQSWWKCYTDIKHWRIDKFNEANLENVLNALAAVFILDSLFMINFPRSYGDKSVDAPEISSRLFSPQNFGFTARWGGFVTLPD